MPLSFRQKHIINPYAQQLFERWAGMDSYTYSDPRNKFVIDAIHHYYLQLGSFPALGTRLDVSGEPFTRDNSVIVLSDLLAYVALYPQTAVYDSQTSSLRLATDREADQAFSDMITTLEAAGKLDRYTSDSTEESLVNGFEELSDLEQAKARLVAIPSLHSQEYIRNLNTALDIPEPPTPDDILEQFDSTLASRYLAANDPTVDLYNWKNNCLPDTQREKVYYNSNNDTLVFTIRTTDTTYQKYDIGYLMVEQPWWLEEADNWLREQLSDDTPLPTSDEIVQNYMSIIIKGLQEILSFAGKSSRSNLSTLLGPSLEEESSRALRLLVALNSPLATLIAEEERGWFDGLTGENESALDSDSIRYRVTSHLDSRPGSRWIFRVAIERRFIDELPGGSIVAPSYEEDELTALERATIILDDEQNNPTKKKLYSVDQTYRYVSSTVQLFREYDRQLLEEGIGPSFLNNLDVGFEATKISNFSDYLGLFYSYNKLNIDVDDDRIEFFMNDDYSLRYMCINGNVYTRGLGNTTFYPNATSDERILNAFSLYTGTTFSYMFYLRELYETYQSNSRRSLPPWGEVLPRYTYPPLELRAGQLQKIAADAVMQKIRLKKKNIFQTISEITQTSISPEELEILFSKRKRKYQVRTLLGPSIGKCRTGQAKSLQLGLNIYAEMLGKKRYLKIMRETIMFLRDEIFADTIKNYTSQGGTQAQVVNMGLNFAVDASTYAQRPDIFYRQVEQAINQQISCALSLGANGLESAFLDPVGAPPEVKDLVRRGGQDIGNQFKFKLQNPFVNAGAMLPSEAQRKAWKWAVTKILENFVKSILVGILRDIIEASLGCGPKHMNRKGALQEYSNSLRNSFALENYGFSNLNNYTEGVDYYTLALATQLISSSTANNDATSKALHRFVQDVSLMTTPEELQFLLEGEPNDEMVDLIVETTNGGRVLVGNRNTSTVAQGQTAIEQEITPDDYRQLNITSETVVEFFLAVGNAMFSRDIPVIDLQSPLEAYCDLKNPAEQPLQFILSNDQLAAQYISVAQEKMKMINTLCDLLTSSQNMQAQIGAMVASLPRFDSYNNFLSLLSQASNDFWEWLIKSLNWGSAPEGAGSPVYNIYSTQIGAELYWTTGRLIDEVAGLPEFGFLYDPGSGGGEIDDDYMEIPANAQFGECYHFFTPGRGAGDRTYSTDKLTLPYAPQGRDFTDTQQRALYMARTAPGTIRRKFSMYQVGFDDEVTSNFVKTCDAQISIQNKWLPANGYVNPMVTVPTNSSNGGIKFYKSLPDNWMHGTYKNAQLWLARNNIVATYRQPGPDFLASYNFKTPGTASQEPWVQGAIDYNFYQEMLGRNGILTRRYNVLNQTPQEAANNVSLIPYGHQDNADAWQAMLIRAARGYYYDAAWYAENPQERPQPWEGNPSRDTDVFENVLFWNERPYSLNTDALAVVNDTSRLATDYIPSMSVHNTRESIEQMLTAYLATEKGNRRFQRIAAVMTQNPLKALPNDCPNLKKESQAEALRLSIQQRIQEFMFNVCPLFRIYPDFKNVGTIKVICDYLTRKCVKEWTQSQALGSAYEAIDSFEYIYGTIKIDPNLEYDEYKAKIFGIIERLLIGSDIQLEYITPQEAQTDDAERGFLQMLNIRSIFDWNPANPSISGKRYERFLTSFYISVYDQLVQRNRELRDDYGLLNDQRLRVVSTLQDFLEAPGGSYSRENYKNMIVNKRGLKYGTYYYPVAIQIASYYLYFAEGLRYINRFTETAAKQNSLKASFDKSLIFTVKGIETPYRRDLLQYPIEVPTAIRARENYASFAVTDGTDQLNSIEEGRTISYIAGGSSFEQTRVYYNRAQLEERRQFLVNSIVEELSFIVEAGDESQSLIDRFSHILDAPLLQYLRASDYSELFFHASDRGTRRNFQGRVVTAPGGIEIKNPVYDNFRRRLVGSPGDNSPSGLCVEVRRNIGGYLDTKNVDLLIAELERWYSDVDTQYNQDLEDEVDLQAGREPDGSTRSKNALANSQVREILNYILVDAGFKFVLQEIRYIDEQMDDSISPNVTVI